MIVAVGEKESLVLNNSYEKRFVGKKPLSNDIKVDLEEGKG